MALLSATLFATFLAQALWLGKTVAGRRFATISAVGVDLILQLLHPGGEKINLKHQSLDQGIYRIGSLIVDDLKFFTCQFEIGHEAHLPSIT
jgi:hypothetical protein